MFEGQTGNHLANGRDESGDYTTCQDVFVNNKILYETNNLESSGSGTALYLDRMFDAVPALRRMYNDFKKSLNLTECYCDRARTTIAGCTCQPLVRYVPIPVNQTLDMYCTNQSKCLRPEAANASQSDFYNRFRYYLFGPEANPAFNHQFYIEPDDLYHATADHDLDKGILRNAQFNMIDRNRALVDEPSRFLQDLPSSYPNQYENAFFREYGFLMKDYLQFDSTQIIDAPQYNFNAWL
jgi:hypothetical protein